MKIIILLIFFIPLTLFSQTKLPYKVGNGWYYKNSAGDKWGGIIINENTFDGYSYFVFNNGEVPLQFISLTRVDSDFTYFHYIENKSEKINSKWVPFFFGKQKMSKDIIWNDTTYSIEGTDTVVNIRSEIFNYTSFEPLTIFGVNDTVEYRGIDLGVVQRSQIFSRKFGLLQDQNSEGDVGNNSSVLWGCVIDGIAYGDTTGLVNVEQNKPYLPFEPTIFQNYPNPFNPTTNIPISLPINSIVRLSIFDLTGREVSVLRNGFMPAGIYLETFKSSGLASGAYIVKLQAGNQTISRVIILNK